MIKYKLVINGYVFLNDTIFWMKFFSKLGF